MARKSLTPQVATITLFFFAISLLKYNYWASERSCQLLAWGYNGIKALLEEGLFAMVCNSKELGGRRLFKFLRIYFLLPACFISNTHPTVAFEKERFEFPTAAFLQFLRII